LAKAAGDVEIIAILEGYWPAADDPLPDDPRVVVLHHGQALGMRPSINHAARIAKGDYFLKADAHTMWDEGFDEKLKADYLEDNWILVPRRYALDPINWTFDTSNSKYPVDYHFLSSPFHQASNSTQGLHGSPWTARREARKHVMLDDELSTQGSAWFMSRAHWDRIGPMNSELFGCFWFEAQEIGLRTWMMGGAMKVSKRTHYAHLYKGTRFGRGYHTRGMGHEAGNAFCSWFHMTDQDFKGKTRSFRSVIEQFAPVPTWDEIDAIFARAQATFTNPYLNAA